MRHLNLKKSLGILLIGFLCSGTYFYATHRGFVQEFFADLQHASWAEMIDQYTFLYYYAHYYERLSRRPDTEFYDFQQVAEKYRNHKGTNDFENGKMSYHLGDFGTAVSQIQADITARGETESKLFWLALSYMRAAEAENCLAPLTDQTADHMPHRDLTRICTLPITAFHMHPQGSNRAAQTLKRLLDTYDGKNRLYQWLLNFCYMTTDRFPQDVPPQYLIKSDFIDHFYGPPDAQYKELAFQDQAKALGVDTNDSGKGVAVEDFNQDGYLDIVTGGTFNTLKYYENDRGIKFTDKTASVGLSHIIQPYIITAADYNNDGWIDIFVARPFHRFGLYRNNRDGTFSDVTFSSGLLAEEPADDQAIYTCVSAWADIDNDGDLDLFLAQFGQKYPLLGGLLSRTPMSSRLFMNEGENHHFVDRTDAYGLTDLLHDNVFIGATFGDYDKDGWQDLFISSFTRGKSVLLKNSSGTSFEKTDLIHVSDPGFMAAFVDVNHDGQLDLFQGSLGPAQSITENVVFGTNPDRYTNKIFLQEQGQFQKRSDLFEGHMPIGTMGASYGDLNNDGCHDFYLGTGNPEGWFILPNLMYLGKTEGTQCTGQMANISKQNGFGTIQKGHGIVFFDFDNDGDQDIYSSLGGMWPADAWPNQLFVNNSVLQNTWVKIRLRGRKTNRFGIGSTIRVTAVNKAGEKIVRTHHMDNKTGFGSAPYLAHIGLLDATRILDVEVYWPASKTTKYYPAVIKQLNLLDEEEGKEQ